MASSDGDADTESIPSQGSQEHDSGSENGDGDSVAVEFQEQDEVERVEPLQFAPVGRRVREGFAALHSVDFRRQAHVMRSVPVVIKGAHTAAMRMSMEEVLRSKRVTMLNLNRGHGGCFCCSHGCFSAGLPEAAKC